METAMQDESAYEARPSKDGWVVFNVTTSQTLLGVYETQGAAERMAMRLTSGFNPTGSGEGALRALASKGRMTVREFGVAYKGPDSEGGELKSGDVYSKRLEKAGLVARVEGDVVITRQGLDWLGLPSVEAPKVG